MAAANLKIAALDRQVEALQKTVAALPMDSEQGRAVLRQADSAIASAREAAQTSEAEFSANADTNIQLVPFDNDSSLKLAAEISASLTQKGFKISQAPWGARRERFYKIFRSNISQ